MSKNVPLVVAGILFTLIALGHLYRIIYPFNIMIMGYNIPVSASIGGLIVAGCLALWMFVAAKK